MPEHANCRVPVPFVDEDQLRGIYVVRHLVEPYAIERAVRRITPRALVEATRINSSIANASGRGDAVAIQHLDRRLHFLLYGACGAAGILRHIRDLWIRSPSEFDLDLDERVGAAVEEHQAILGVMSRRDVRGAGEAMRGHLCAEYTAVVEGLTGRTPDDLVVTTNAQ